MASFERRIAQRCTAIREDAAASTMGLDGKPMTLDIAPNQKCERMTEGFGGDTEHCPISRTVS